jgi:signal transduction histidine kinase
MRPASSRAWFAPLPTTTAGVARALALFVAGVRLGTLVQMVPSFTVGLRVSPIPSLYAACWCAAAAMAVGVSTFCLVRGRVPSSRVAVADLAVACSILLLSPLVVRPQDRVGTWVGYQPGNAISVVTTTSAVLLGIVWGAGLLAVVACYVVHLAGAFNQVTLSTAVGNELTFVVYALVCKLFASHSRRVAEEADASRQLAAKLARRDEERRAQILMHNGVAVMRLLTEPGLSDAARARLIDQAQVELQQMRAYLVRRSGDDSLPSSTALGAASLADAVERTCVRFSDLPIEPLLDLGADVVLSPADVQAVIRALDSVLLNVRSHARARQVVVHLDGDVDGRWVLSVHDDGVGFDPGSTALGLGLGEVVVGELRRRGLGARVDSSPGDGTTVTIDGLGVPATAVREPLRAVS